MRERRPLAGGLYAIDGFVGCVANNLRTLYPSATSDLHVF